MQLQNFAGLPTAGRWAVYAGDPDGGRVRLSCTCSGLGWVNRAALYNERVNAVLAPLPWPLCAASSDCIRAVPRPDLVHGAVESALLGAPGVVEEIALCRGVVHEPSRANAEQTDRENRLWNAHFEEFHCRLPDDGGYVGRLIERP